MTKTQDPTAMIKDFLSAFNVDTTSFEDAFKNSSELNSKMSGMALEAAGKASEISSNWTAETISKLTEMTKPKGDPSDYAKMASDFASAQAELTTENLAAFAELAKKVQMETIELVTSAGKEITEETVANVKKTTESAVKAAKAAQK